MKKDIKSMPLTDIAVYSQQLQVYIGDLQQMLEKIKMIKETSKFFDNDSKIKNAVIGKLTDAGMIYNELQIEVQERAERDLGFQFDYDKLTDYDTQVKTAYMKHLGEMMKKQGVQMANSPDNPEILNPANKIISKGKKIVKIKPNA